MKKTSVECTKAFSPAQRLGAPVFAQVSLSLGWHRKHGLLPAPAMALLPHRQATEHTRGCHSTALL